MNNDDRNDNAQSENPSTTSPSPGLLIRLTDPPKIFLLCEDMEGEHGAREMADTIKKFLGGITQHRVAA